MVQIEVEIISDQADLSGNTNALKVLSQASHGSHRSKILNIRQANKSTMVEDDVNEIRSILWSESRRNVTSVILYRPEKTQETLQEQTYPT